VSEEVDEVEGGEGWVSVVVASRVVAEASLTRSRGVSRGGVTHSDCTSSQIASEGTAVRESSAEAGSMVESMARGDVSDGERESAGSDVRVVREEVAIREEVEGRWKS
jgi:hypothetical protein